jgi:hypothetical protein
MKLQEPHVVEKKDSPIKRILAYEMLAKLLALGEEKVSETVMSVVNEMAASMGDEERQLSGLKDFMTDFKDIRINLASNYKHEVSVLVSFKLYVTCN